MGIVTVKSSVITNRDATPAVISNASVANSRLHEAVATVEVANGDSIASKYIMASVPSNARISRVLLSCDAIASTTAADIGVYKTTKDGGAVVDADLFASAQVLTSALVNTDVTHESGVFGIDEVEKPLWEIAGLSADPGIMYDVVVTLTAAAEAAGTVSLKVQYVI